MAPSFERKWAEKEVANGIPYEIQSRMVTIGNFLLPSEAAPCLSFHDAPEQKHIYEIFGFPEQWSDAERDRLSEYVVIGSDGAGNSICQRKSDNSIVLVDHDDGFRTVQFVNSSLQTLQESLIAYYGETDPAVFISAMKKIDPSAVEKETFWYCEASGIQNENT